MSANLVKESNKNQLHFEGYPYLITRLVSALHHIAPLPESLKLKEYFDIAINQVRANKLPACLILGPDKCVYFYSDGRAEASDSLPINHIIATKGLKLYGNYLVSAELLARKIQLLEYERKINGKESKYLAGDLQKGGRAATTEELERLVGRQSNGIPTGLIQCPACHEWHGECIDPSPDFKKMLMKVLCRCANDNLCAGCGNAMYHHKLNSNYFDECDGSIWHVPGFCGLAHECDK